MFLLVFCVFRSTASAVPHQLNANNEWHKIIIKRNEVLKKSGGKLEVIMIIAVLHLFLQSFSQVTYKKCLNIILESIREKLISFLSMSIEEGKGLAAITEYSDSRQKEQYKSYGLLLSSCHIKKSELGTEKIEYVSLMNSRVLELKF